MQNKFSEILLIDDDLITNYITQDLLLDLQVGDKITIYQNGQEALGYIKAHWLATQKEKQCYKLILLDLNMPLMSGFEFLDHFFTLQMPDVRIFVLTTSEGNRDLEKAKEYKIDGYLLKPLETNPDFIKEMTSQLFINQSQ